MYNVDSGNLGARTGFIFAGISLILLIVAVWIVPETAGLSVEEIDNLYTSGVPAWKFQREVSRAAEMEKTESEKIERV
jgi:hypothetical protein